MKPLETLYLQKSFKKPQKLSDRIDKLISLDPKEKAERLDLWYQQKELDAREKREKEAIRRKRLAKKAQQELVLKRAVLMRWKEAKERQDRLIINEKARQKLVNDRKKKEEKEKIRAIGERMYKVWLKIKEKEEIQRKRAQRVANEEQAELKRQRQKMAEQVFNEWLKMPISR